MQLNDPKLSLAPAPPSHPRTLATRTSLAPAPTHIMATRTPCN